MGVSNGSLPTLRSERSAAGANYCLQSALCTYYDCATVHGPSNFLWSRSL